MSNLNWAKLRDQCLVAVAAIFFLYALWWVVSHFLVHAAVLVLLAIVVAAALEPILSRLERFMPRVVAALAAYLFAAAAVGIGLYLFLGPLVFQSSGLSGRLPIYFDNFLGAINHAAAANFGIVLPPPDQVRASLAKAAQGQLQQIIFQAIGYLQLVAGVAADTALVLLLAFWFMVDGARVRAAFAQVVPARYRQRVRFVEDTLSTVLGGYIRGQLTMAAIIGISAGVGCWLLGVQYPIVIGVLAFFFELVPMVGPILAALPAVMISAFQPFPLVLLVLAFFIAMQFVENNILAPRITAGAVGLHPIAAILGLVAGFEAAGIVGALFALPLLSAVSVIGAAALKSWRGEPVVVKRGEMTFRMPSFRRPKAPPKSAA
ncbi:MAG TPA: AI-2E family transporter [Candidatus Dormibacteraeota bacterium]|jgi:predicted PurR-regulated permease PerM